MYDWRNVARLHILQKLSTRFLFISYAAYNQVLAGATFGRKRCIKMSDQVDGSVNKTSSLEREAWLVRSLPRSRSQITHFPADTSRGLGSLTLIEPVLEIVISSVADNLALVNVNSDEVQSIPEFPPCIIFNLLDIGNIKTSIKENLNDQSNYYSFKIAGNFVALVMERRQ